MVLSLGVLWLCSAYATVAVMWFIAHTVTQEQRLREEVREEAMNPNSVSRWSSRYN